MWHSKRRAHRCIGQLAGVRIQAIHQVLILRTSIPPTMIGDIQHMRQCRIAKGDGGCTRNGTWHVGDAVMHDPVYFVDRIVVRCCL